RPGSRRRSAAVFLGESAALYLRYCSTSTGARQSAARPALQSGTAVIRPKKGGATMTVATKASGRKLHTVEYLTLIGVSPLRPAISPFDPGYDPMTLDGHLGQSAHLMSILKISMACWLIAAERATRRKIAAARRHGVPTVVGGGPFEVAVAQGQLPAYLDLCADLGVTRVECGEGFTDLPFEPPVVVAM